MEVNNRKKRNSKRKKNANPLGLKIKQIPNKKLQNALEILNDPENDVYKDRSMACEKSIHYFKQACAYKEETNDILNMDLRLRYAQTCLLRRDWKNLAEIILLYKPDKSNEHLLRLFAKYASICLTYTNQPLLKSFLQSLNCTESTEVVLNNWISLESETQDNIQLA